MQIRKATMKDAEVLLSLYEDLGYPVKLVNSNEYKKIDGSLTCLSLRF